MGAQPYEKVWGPLLRGKFGDRADDISMAWLWGKLTMRRKLEGKEARQELLGYPRPLVGAAVPRAAGADRDARRARADRPARGAARAARRRLRGHRRRARLVPPRPRPARVRARRRAERYDAVVATVPNDVFVGLLDDELAAAIGAEYLGRARAHRVPHRALPAARARPPVQPLLLDQHRRPRAAVRRARRAHQLRRARALRRPALPLRRQLPRPRRRAARARRRRADRALHARAAQGQPGLRALMGQAALAAPRAGRPADRHRRLPRADPAAADRRRRTSCSPTRRRSIPRTAAPTTPCGWAATPRRRCSRGA